MVPTDGEIADRMLVRPATVVVLGLARGGTSTVAGILHCLGVDLGPNRSPSEANPTGSWEDRRFQDLDAQIIHAAGGDYWHDPPNEERLSAVADQFESRIRELANYEGRSKIWGWKSPSTVLTLDLYLPYLVNPCLCVVRRDFETVAQSLVRFTAHEQKLNIHSARSLVARMSTILESKLFAHRNIPRITVQHEDAVSHPDAELVRLGDFLGIEASDSQMSKTTKMVVSPNRLMRKKRIGLLLSIPDRSRRWLKACARNPKQAPHLIRRATALFWERLRFPSGPRI